jgi:hypothetical protein
MVPDIAFADRAQKRVCNRVAKHVRIRMSLETALIWNLHAAENQLSIRGETMRVVPISTPDHA